MKWLFVMLPDAVGTARRGRLQCQRMAGGCAYVQLELLIWVWQDVANSTSVGNRNHKICQEMLVCSAHLRVGIWGAESLRAGVAACVVVFLSVWFWVWHMGQCWAGPERPVAWNGAFALTLLENI